MKLVPTPFNNLNSILNGGIPLNTFVGFIGFAGEGKSILTLELAIHAAKQLNGNVLVVNTEEPEGITTSFWGKNLSEKYAFQGQIYEDYAANVEQLFKLHGIDTTVELGEKTEFVTKKISPFTSKISDYLRNKNVKVVIYDSLSAPFNALIGGGRQNLPTRHIGQELFFEILRTISLDINAMFLSINHITFNPTQPYQTKEDLQMKGGKTLLHAHKVVFDVEQSKSRYTADIRKLWIVRHPILPDWKFYTTLLLGNDGYKEITDAELRQIYIENQEAIKGKGTKESVVMGKN